MKYERKEIYRDFLSLVYKNNVGHIGSCLSVMDILISLYFLIQRVGEKIILSKGHAAPALYVVLAARGILSKKKLTTFHLNNSDLPVHVPNGLIKNEIPFASGSLGHGLSLACGIAHANKLKRNDKNVYCVMSDGECNEGQVWEAAQYAAQFKLNNLIVFIDVNNLQAFGTTLEVLGRITTDKWKAFGWKTYECNGHSIHEIISSYKKTRSPSLQPKVILCHTIKGFGLSFFENKLKSHYLPLTEKQYNLGLLEVQKL